jgi:BclA-like protein
VPNFDEHSGSKLVRIALHSKAASVVVSVLAMGSVVVAGLGSAPAAVGLTAQTTAGGGYWMAGSDGGVFAFGTAHFYGSLAGKHLNAPISEIVPTSDEQGYWLVGRDGAVYPFGDAATKGSMSGKALAAPVVSAAATGGGTSGNGPQGPAGARGLTGPPGPAAAVNYSYIYNTVVQTVAIEDDVTFDTNGPMLGFSHTPGTTQLVVPENGVYRAEFSVSGIEPGQFTLTVNGIAVTGTTYGSGAGTQQNGGSAILELDAGSVVTLRNHSSASAVTLQSPAGGTQANVDASMVLQEIGQPVP